MTIMRLNFLLNLLAVDQYMALDNGIGNTPPMGFNPWNCFGIRRTGDCKLPLPWLPESGARCHGFDEGVMLDIAKAVANSPLKAAGYQYINLDCGYSTKRRSANGSLVVNTTRYPNGMVWFGQQLHALGLKFGMYSSGSLHQCCSQIDPDADDGSAGHEADDAQLFASWGVDYLKHDDCTPISASYEAMRDAINATGRPMFYSIHPPADMIGRADIANMWRSTSDINNTYESIMEKALLNNDFADRAKPGAWNDPDMLEVGNFFSPFGDAEGRTQFSLWCLMKAPLLIGTDITNTTAATMATLSNADAIAINQDPLGVQGVLRADGPLSQVWSGELSGHRFAVVLHNKGNDTNRLVALRQAGLPLGVDVGAVWSIRDVWKNRTLTDQQLPVYFKVGPRDTALLVLSRQDEVVLTGLHKEAISSESALIDL